MNCASGRGLLLRGRHLVRGVRERCLQLDVLGVGRASSDDVPASEGQACRALAHSRRRAAALD